MELSLDEDIKIAPDDMSKLLKPQPCVQDEVDQYEHHRENGNVELAKQLGQHYADGFIELASQPSIEGHIITQEKLLYSYVVCKVVNRFSPNSILAQTTLSTYYNVIREYNEADYEIVLDDTGFTLYILEDRSDDHMGEVFAELCDRRTDTQYITLGDQLYKQAFRRCREAIEETPYK